MSPDPFPEGDAPDEEFLDEPAEAPDEPRTSGNSDHGLADDEPTSDDLDAARKMSSGEGSQSNPSRGSSEPMPDEPTLDRASMVSTEAPRSQTAPEPRTSPAPDEPSTDPASIASEGDSQPGAEPDEPALDRAGMVPEEAPRSQTAPEPKSFPAPDEPSTDPASIASEGDSQPGAAPDEPALDRAGMAAKEALRSKTAPEPATPAEAPADGPSTADARPEAAGPAPGTVPGQGTDGAGKTPIAGPQSRAAAEQEQSSDDMTGSEQNMTPQRMSPDFRTEGAEPEGWLEDTTLKLGVSASFQFFGQGGSLEAGLTDVGADSFADVYFTSGWGLGGGLAGSVDLVGGVVADSEKFTGKSVEAGAGGGFVSDFGVGASFPRTRSDVPLGMSESEGLNAVDLSIGIGGGGEVHVRSEKTTVWDVK